jgi:UDP-glucose 4-epimerase
VLATKDEGKGKVLIFGGNGFIGSHLAELILNEGYQIIMVNRNNSYYDFDTRLRPRVTLFKCDRPYATMDCEDMRMFIKNNQFELVVDLTADSRRVIGETFNLIDGRTKLYIYPSSDHVYALMEEKPVEGGFIEEYIKNTDRTIVRSPDDRYGHGKHVMEQLIVKQRENDGVPYVILRLADVFGPRDTAFRFTKYMIWLKLAEKIKERGIPVPKHIEQNLLSLVYVEDVAKLINFVWKRPETWDDIYNVANYPPTVNLAGFLKMIAKEMKVEANIDVAPRKDMFWMYPSMDVSYTNASKLHKLGFEMTPLEEAVKRTVAFNDDEFFSDPKYKRQLYDIAEEFPESFFKEQPREAAIQLKEYLGLEYKRFLRNYNEL